MDNEKIKALAQKFAEYMSEPFECASDEIALEYFKAANVFLRWLSKTHCIIEKDKIRTAHECEVVNWYEEQNPHLRDEFLHGRRLLESLFGKEFFNTTER